MLYRRPVVGSRYHLFFSVDTRPTVARRGSQGTQRWRSYRPPWCSFVLAAVGVLGALWRPFAVRTPSRARIESNTAVNDHCLGVTIDEEYSNVYQPGVNCRVP